MDKEKDGNLIHCLLFLIKYDQDCPKVSEKSCGMYAVCSSLIFSGVGVH